MARRPTPCGQRIQPLFARSENVKKKTVKMIFDLFGLDLVRQQPTSLGLGRDSPEDRLLDAHPVCKDPPRLGKDRTGTLKQRMADCLGNPRGATLAIRVLRLAVPDHARRAHRQRVRAEPQLGLQSTAMAKAARTDTRQIRAQAAAVAIGDLGQLGQRRLRPQVVFKCAILPGLDVFLRLLLRRVFLIHVSLPARGLCELTGNEVKGTAYAPACSERALVITTAW